MPLRGSKAGLRIVIVRDSGLEHRCDDLGELPNRVTLEQ
jgi:hypothetical protein